MYNNRKQKKQKRMMIFIVSVVIFSGLSLFVGRNSSNIESMIRDSVAVIEYYTIKRPIEVVSTLFSEYRAMKDVYDENERLRLRIDEYIAVAAQNELLQKEINALKDLTSIDYLPTEYEVEYAAVNSRSSTSWTSEISINLGSFAGVQEDMAVISEQGMLGYISSVTELTSTVTLLCAEKQSTKIPVRIESGNDVFYGLLEQYNVENQTYEVMLLDNVTALEPDAKVFTSGLGGDGKTPAGIYIGLAVELYSRSNDASTSLRVEPAVSFDDLRYVSIVKRVNGYE